MTPEQTPEQAKVVRIHALRESATDSLAKARRDNKNAEEHVLDALGALRLALKLEEEQAA